MIISFGSLAASTPYLGVILLFIVLAWMRAGASLSKQFTDLNIKEQKAKLMESQAATGLAGAKFKFVSKVNEQVRPPGWGGTCLSFHLSIPTHFRAAQYMPGWWPMGMQLCRHASAIQHDCLSKGH